MVQAHQCCSSAGRPQGAKRDRVSSANILHDAYQADLKRPPRRRHHISPGGFNYAVDSSAVRFRHPRSWSRVTRTRHHRGDHNQGGTSVPAWEDSCSYPLSSIVGSPGRSSRQPTHRARYDSPCTRGAEHLARGRFARRSTAGEELPAGSPGRPRHAPGRARSRLT